MELPDQLRKFRTLHPCQYLSVADVRWEYLAGGSGARTLLLLPGGMRTAESAYGYIEMFEGKYRVLTPTYPPLESIDDLLDGMAAILDHEGTGRVSVFGQSAGGVIAQTFVQRFPSRAEKLVLCGTVPLRNPKWKDWILGIYNRIIPRLSEKAALRLYRNMIESVMDVPETRAAFWKAYLDGLFSSRLTKADVLSHFRTGGDALRKYGYDRPGIRPWPGEVLILFGEKDPVSSKADRKAMRSFYPHSRIQAIPGARHMPALFHTEAFRTAVDEFLCA
ncbi:MAG: alpha/beta hydrolase [Anaerolineales bacterium]|nr:alpha/beta hydrolase [Anaerolineales bacterium]